MAQFSSCEADAPSYACTFLEHIHTNMLRKRAHEILFSFPAISNLSPLSSSSSRFTLQKFLLNNNNHWHQRGKYDKCTEQCTPVRAFCTFRPWQLHSQRPYRARCERSREKWVGCLSSSIAYRFTINLQIYMNTTWFHSCTAIEMKMLQYILVRARVK